MRATSMLKEYIVTVQLRQYLDVRARDEEDAAKRALQDADKAFGAGRQPVVIKVEEG